MMSTNGIYEYVSAGSGGDHDYRLSIRLTRKYGQILRSRPRSRTSARVQMPGGIKLPGSSFPRFYEVLEHK